MSDPTSDMQIPVTPEVLGAREALASAQDCERDTYVTWMSLLAEATKAKRAHDLAQALADDARQDLVEACRAL